MYKKKGFFSLLHATVLGFFFFFENNTNIKTILLVSIISKLFSKLTSREWEGWDLCSKLSITNSISMKICLEFDFSTLEFHKRKPKSWDTLLLPLLPLWQKKVKNKKIHDNQRDNKNTNTNKDQSRITWSFQPWTVNPSNKTHELRQWTHNLSDETHDPGGETYEPKLGLNPRLRQRSFSPLFLSFLFVQSRNLSV